MDQLTTTHATPVAERPEASLGSAIDTMAATSAEIESLRGVSDAAADVSECLCPESCERDHANE
jgi:hypothetical protein